VCAGVCVVCSNVHDYMSTCNVCVCILLSTPRQHECLPSGPHPTHTYTHTHTHTLTHTQVYSNPDLELPIPNGAYYTNEMDSVGQTPCSMQWRMDMCCVWSTCWWADNLLSTGRGKTEHHCDRKEFVWREWRGMFEITVVMVFPILDWKSMTVLSW